MFLEGIVIPMENDNQENVKKILLMGLDNSGKTSIILSLKGDRNLMSYYSLKPTPGVAYDEVPDVDGKYYIWDLGGQVQYRKKHVENLEKYIEGVSKILYLIDVQDTDRYEEALTYLREVMEKIGNRMGAIQLIFYLHKFDPTIEQDLKNPLHPAIQRLISQIRAMVKKLEVPIFKTSIYTVFRKIAV